jgi:DNA topoisomerase-1
VLGGNGTIDLPNGLVWADDSLAGIRRRRAGKGFVYLGPDGRRVTAETTVARIRALAVPPAWSDVWICADERGHMQATGRDARGRKQYRYHRRFRAHREEEKFSELYEFGTALPQIRARVAADLIKPGVPRDKVLATVVRLLESTLVRVGNEEYARTNNSYGLTTLRSRHVEVTSDGLRLVFRGKHGTATAVRVQDRRLSRVVKQCQDLPGQLLFQYLDEAGEPCPVTSTDVNDYLRDAAEMPVTAKYFRTWMATVLAAASLAEEPAPTTESARKRVVNATLEEVSSQLGNTPAVCRASYVHPSVLEWYMDDSLHTRWKQASGRGSRRLLLEERKLLRLLRPRRSQAGSRRAA